jgi:hypothetical protein
MRARGRICWAATLAWMCACSGDQARPPATRGSSVRASASATATQAARGPAGTTRKSASGGKRASALPPAALDAGAAPPLIVEQNPFESEEREPNPYSESVTLKLKVTPQVKAVVLWGARQMAHLEPGEMDAEITRPRGSGPLDLEVKAEGYLPYHTRLYADRNDKVGVRLYRPEEAPNLFGYQRSPDVKQADAEKPERPEKQK